ncbi:MAG: RNA-guided endonuclease InsQ/TnpB family protein [Dehalococcoidia bacterium]
MRKTYEYRLYPTRAQADALTAMLETHRRLYNAALEHRRTAYRVAHVSITYGQQSAELKDIRREDPFLVRTNFSSCQATLRRLDRAFQAFFRRFTAGETPGFPRFKAARRFKTVEYPSIGDGCAFAAGERCVYFQHVGRVKVKLHRPLEGTPKTLSFSRKADGWYLLISCDLGDPVVEPSTNPPIGLDLGLISFLATSDGAMIAAPKPYQAAQAKLRRAQRHLARCRRGSNRRKKAVQRVAKQHQHVANVRKDFHHKAARQLVNQYGLIVTEALSVRGIARSRLAKATHDAGWTQFLSILTHKAASAGVPVVAVDPRNTSQACSDCGSLVSKDLSVRLHVCLHCGFTADRDVNAAKNILRLGLSRQARTVPVGAVA